MRDCIYNVLSSVLRTVPVQKWDTEDLICSIAYIINIYCLVYFCAK